MLRKVGLLADIVEPISMVNIRRVEEIRNSEGLNKGVRLMRFEGCCRRWTKVK